MPNSGGDVLSEGEGMERSSLGHFACLRRDSVVKSEARMDPHGYTQDPSLLLSTRTGLHGRNGAR